MATYRVKIVKLKHHDHTDKLVAFLFSQPGMTADKIVLGLQHPPMELAPVTTEKLAKSLASKLTRYGASCTVEVFDAPDESSHGAEPRAYVFDAAEIPKIQLKQLWKLGLSVLAVLALFTFLFLHRDSTPATNTKSTSSLESPSQASSPNAKRKTVAKPSNPKKTLKAGMKEKHTLAKQQQAYSQQMLERSKQSTNPQEAIQMLQTAVQYNPYNTEAWKQLEQKMLETGNAQSAEQARKSHEQAMRVQNTMQSLASAFGKSQKVSVSTAAITYKTTAPMEDESFYESADKLYDKISATHPDKELIIENEANGHTQRIHIEPGKPFPNAIETE